MVVCVLVLCVWPRRLGGGKWSSAAPGGGGVRDEKPRSVPSFSFTSAANTSRDIRARHRGFGVDGSSIHSKVIPSRTRMSGKAMNKVLGWRQGADDSIGQPLAVLVCLVGRRAALPLGLPFNAPFRLNVEGSGAMPRSASTRCWR